MFVGDIIESYQVQKPVARRDTLRHLLMIRAGIAQLQGVYSLQAKHRVPGFAISDSTAAEPGELLQVVRFKPNGVSPGPGADVSWAPVEEAVFPSHQQVRHPLALLPLNLRPSLS